MLNLKQLRFCNIGRFVEEQIVSFDAFGNIIQVDGQNLNTEGSSGAGKSTVFNALDFLFGISSLPNTLLQSRLTDESIIVEADFDYNGIPLTISRGKKLKITLDGVVTTGSSEVSEKKLDEIIAIPRNLFRQMLHKKQGEKGFFLNLGPKNTNDFLTDCLNLSHYKKNIADLDVKIADISKMITSLSTEFESAKSALDASKNAIMALGEPPQKEVHQSTIVELKAKADEARTQLSALMATQKAKLDEFEKNRPALETKSYDFTKKKELKNALDAIDAEILQINKDETDRQTYIKEQIADLRVQQKDFDTLTTDITSYKEQAVKYALELKKVRSNICYTCSQPWTNEEATHQAKNLEEKIHLCKKTSDDAFQKRIKLGNIPALLLHLQEEVKPQIPAALVDLKTKKKDLEAQIAEEDKKAQDLANALHYANKLRQDQFAEQQKELRALHFQQSEFCRGQVELTQRVLESAIGKFKAFEESIKRYDSQYKAISELAAQHEIRIKEKEEALMQAKKKCEFFEELKRAVKSYLSRSFDDALEEIGENATKMLRNIPNMSNATIQLSGVKETKEGKVKEEVTAQLHMDGEENVDIRTLSGGERASTDLAMTCQ